MKSVRCHPRVHLHVQASGRWSTVEPPLATLPRDGSLDGLYVPDPGEAWVEYDMMAVEMRVMAAEAGETRMLDAFREGRDLHTENTMVIFGWSELPADWQGKQDERRTFGKTFGHRLDYLGDPRRCMDIPNAQKLGLTAERLQRAAEAYFTRYPRLRAYHRRKTQEYAVTREARTFLGRRRRGFSAGMALVRELVNHPFQGGVADVFNRTALQVWQALRPLGGRFVFQRHDAATWGVPVGQVDEAMRRIEAVFDAPWRINGHDVRIPIAWKEVRYADLSSPV